MDLKLQVGKKIETEVFADTSDEMYFLRTLLQFKEYLGGSLNNIILIKEPSQQMCDAIKECLATIEITQKQREQYVKDTAANIVADLTEKDKQALLDNPEYGRHHFRFGLWIRNTYIHGKELPMEYHSADDLGERIFEEVVTQLKG